MSQSLSGKIIKNTALNAVGSSWGILIAVFLTPYILKHVGIERYGIWAIVGVITGYFSLLDFGMGTSYVKYISEYHAKKDQKSISQLVSTGVIFYLVFAALLLPLAFLFVRPLLGVFRITPGLYGEAAFVLKFGVVLFAVSSAVSAFGAIQQGLQRMDISTRISIAVSIPMVLGTVYVLEHGYGLRGLMVNNAIVLVLASAANIIMGFRLLPELRVGFKLCGKEMFLKLFRFGYKLQFSKVAEVLVFQTDRLLLAYFFNIGSVGFYQLGSSITQQVRQIPLLLVSAVLPAASDLDARNEHDRIRELYVRGSKYLVLASFPLFLLLMASARLLIAVWVGPGYERSAWIIQILAAGYLANLLAGVGTSVGAAIGKPEFQMGAAIISAVTNVILSLLLINLVGFFGVALASAAALIFGPVYFFMKLHSQLRLSSVKIMRELVAVPLLASVLPGILILVYNFSVPAPANRAFGFGVLCLQGAVFLAVYSVIILKSGCLDAYDRALAKRLAARSGFFPGLEGRC